MLAVRAMTARASRAVILRVHLAASLRASAVPPHASASIGPPGRLIRSEHGSMLSRVWGKGLTGAVACTAVVKLAGLIVTSLAGNSQAWPGSSGSDSGGRIAGVRAGRIVSSCSR